MSWIVGSIPDVLLSPNGIIHLRIMINSTVHSLWTTFARLSTKLVVGSIRSWQYLLRYSTAYATEDVSHWVIFWIKMVRKCRNQEGMLSIPGTISTRKVQIQFAGI